ncbi:MAG: nitrous oxide-stimulated promoter family protein [Deltaproteobacteria bacterium]|nr:MAG: nitrous oxide-stimulated promoter family protein [Deltaproteobacteria bacterium]
MLEESTAKKLSPAAARRLRREMKTVRVMIGMYCHDCHGSRRGRLCADCQQLWEYARRRVAHCRFRDDKPTCAKCPIHCYRPDRRERIRQVMRHAGPRMIWRHPLLAIYHLLDGRRKPPASTPPTRS